MFSVFTHNAWVIVQVFIGCHIVLPVILYLAYYASKIVRKPLPVDEELFEEKDYAVIVSIDKQSDTASSLIEALCNLNYSNYLVYVIVNDCDSKNLHFQNKKIILLPSAKSLTGKVSRQRYVIENFKRSHTHLVVLNSYNMVDEDYLNELNVYFNKGYQAVQSRNAAKQSSSIYDAINTTRNKYHQFFSGGLPFALQSSAMLTGSGMAFTVSLYKRCLKKINTTNTKFASALQYLIVNKGYQIAFAEGATVHLEKQTSTQSLMNQHAGKIHAWIKDFAINMRLLLAGVYSFSMNRILFSLLLLRLPLFTIILSVVFFLVINVWINTTVALLWIGCMALLASCFIIAYIFSRDKKSGRGLLNLLNIRFLFKQRQNHIYPVAS